MNISTVSIIFGITYTDTELRCILMRLSCFCYTIFPDALADAYSFPRLMLFLHGENFTGKTFSRIKIKATVKNNREREKCGKIEKLKRS